MFAKNKVELIHCGKVEQEIKFAFIFIFEAKWNDEQIELERCRRFYRELVEIFIEFST